MKDSNEIISLCDLSSTELDCLLELDQDNDPLDSFLKDQEITPDLIELKSDLDTRRDEYIEFYETEVRDVIKHPFLFSFSIAIFPAVFEELVFRGLIFNKAKEKLSVISSAILSGILFGLYHLDLQQFFYAAILGFIFALIYNKTNNILDVIIIHFLVDFTQLYIATSTLQSETITNALNESDEIFNENTLALSTFILCAVLLLIFVPLTKTFYKKYESVIDENDENNNEEIVNDEIIIKE